MPMITPAGNAIGGKNLRIASVSSAPATSTVSGLSSANVSSGSLMGAIFLSSVVFWLPPLWELSSLFSEMGYVVSACAI